MASVAKLLIAKGANVNVKTKHGVSPLHLAAGANSINVAKILLDNGADVNIGNTGRHLPIHWAAKNGII